MNFFKSVNIWQRYKQERVCLVYFLLADRSILVKFGMMIGDVYWLQKAYQ